MLVLKEKEKCTGCTACYAACPIQCIDMVADNEGFLYPVPSDKCVHCGRCEAVCPKLNFLQNETSFKQRAFAAVSKKKKNWSKSTSGGAFYNICLSFGDDNTLICGAAWEGLSVQHKCVVGVEKALLFSKSKYVASDLKTCFLTIKEHLKKGEKAIFCGTPCQVAGLKKYLGGTNDKLLLIDLICHGVGSPLVFKSCVSLIGKQLHIEPNHYSFREKPFDTFFTRHICSISDFSSKTYLVNDQYMQLFLKQLCLRPSCGSNCIYRNRHREGDITIADFNGSTVKIKNLPSTKNWSTIVFNSEKGYEIYNQLRKNMFLEEYPIEDVEKYNPLFGRQTQCSNERDAFFSDFVSNEQLITKWVYDSEIFKISLAKRVFYNLPTFLRTIIGVFYHGRKQKHD